MVVVPRGREDNRGLEESYGSLPPCFWLPETGIGWLMSMVDWVRLNYCPTKHIIGHIGDGFSQVKDPTNSVKALKEHITKLNQIEQNTRIHLN